MTTTYNLRDFSDIKYRNKTFLSEEEMQKINDIADILNIYINPPSYENTIDEVFEDNKKLAPWALGLLGP